jgi:hypothetical protein
MVLQSSCKQGVIHLIHGFDIDRPTNALALAHDLHKLFGNFEVA